MAVYNLGNDILNAFLKGHESAREDRALAAHTEETKLRREQERKIHEDTLKQADTHFNASMALQKAFKDIQMLEAKQKLAKDFAETGIGPSGTAVSETNATTPEQDLQGLNRASTTAMNPLTGGMERSFSGEPGPQTNRTIDLGGDAGQITVPDPFSYSRQRADQARILHAPQEESAIRTAKGIAEVRAPFAQQLEQMKLDAIAAQEVQKFRQKQLEQAGKFSNDQALVRLRAKLRPTPGANAKAREESSYLSPEDTIKLNVPYGTTKGEAARMNLTAEKPRTATEQARLDGMLALRNDLTSLLASGQASNWSEHRAIGAGLMGTVKNKLNLGTVEGAAYRAKFGQINADYIHKTYGSVFSKNEQALANTWLPALSEGGQASAAKLKNGIDHATQQIDMLLAPASSMRRGSTAKGGLKKVFTDPNSGEKVNTVSTDGGITYHEE